MKFFSSAWFMMNGNVCSPIIDLLSFSRILRREMKGGVEAPGARENIAVTKLGNMMGSLIPYSRNPSETNRGISLFESLNVFNNTHNFPNFNFISASTNNLLTISFNNSSTHVAV